MAKKKKQKVSDEAIGLDVQLSKSEAFIEKNLKQILIVLAAIILVVAGIFLWRNHRKSVEQKAQTAISASQALFAQQQYDNALKGDGVNNIGLLRVIDQFGGTKTANLAKLYAAICYANTGKYDEAIKMFESFKPKGDQMISPAALGAMGNCYVAKGDKQKGAETLLKAARSADNNTLSPIFLLQAGEIYESLNQADKALELYKEIKSKYFRSQLSQTIDKYIEKLEKQ